jgi:hypothetical protein
LTSSGFTLAFNCAPPPLRIMASDLLFEIPSPDIKSTSVVEGDLSKQIKVRHVTDVIHFSGRRERIRSTVDITRLGECPQPDGAKP